VGEESVVSVEELQAQVDRLPRARERERRAREQSEQLLEVKSRELFVASEELRVTEENYRGIFENSVEGIFQTTMDGRYLSANPALARIRGYETSADLIAGQDVAATAYTEPGRRDELIQQLRENRLVTGNWKSELDDVLKSVDELDTTSG
jgi:PAS domain S-box-containing protein